MAGFDLINSTRRDGIAVDEVEFEVAGAPPATAYILGRNPEQRQPIAIALHHERGDKATLLPDLEHLASRGFLCLSLDSPNMRSAIAERDHLRAFESQFTAAMTAMALLHEDPNTINSRTALIGRGLGGEVAGHMAAHVEGARVVVAIHPLLERDEFLAESAHPTAAGVRQFRRHDTLSDQLNGLLTRRLLTHLQTSAGIHWLVQVADDDDRLSANDRDTLNQAVPPTVSVDRHDTARDATAAEARRRRVDFVANRCG